MCWDNAAAESFFATLENEMYYRQRFEARAKARFAVADTSKSSTTASDCTPTWDTAPRPKPSPTTRPEQRPDHHNHQELSKILDTAISQSTGTRAGNPATLCCDPGTIDEARAHPGVHNQMGRHQRARPPRTAGTRSRSSRPWLRSCRSAGGRGSRLRPTRHRKAQLHGRPRRIGVGGDDVDELTGNPESDTAPTCGVGAVVAGGREHRR